jgi:hypothetical protein
MFSLRRKQMNKLFSLVFAVALNIAGVATAHTMPVDRFDLKQVSLITTAADGCRGGVHRGPEGCKHSRQHRHNRYSNYAGYYGSGGSMEGRANFCPFGSYVACVYSGTYCWDRCY